MQMKMSFFNMKPSHPGRSTPSAFTSTRGTTAPSVSTEHDKLWTAALFIQLLYLRRAHITFADIPHMVKLMRNHMMDQGLRLRAGDPANRNKIQKLPVVDQTMFVQLLMSVDNAEFS